MRLRMSRDVITSYSIHYTKLYEVSVSVSGPPLVQAASIAKKIQRMRGSDPVEAPSQPGLSGFGAFV